MALNQAAVLKDLGLCARCRQCRMVCEVPIATTMLPICPTGEYWKFDTYFASGRISLAKKYLLGTVEYDDSILKAVYSCTLCGSCKQQCPILNFDPLEATVVMREIAVEKGIADKIYKLPTDNPIIVNIEEDSGSDTALFIGTDAQSCKEQIEAVASVLNKAGIRFKAFTATDCGEYLMRKGDYAAFEEKKKDVIGRLKSENVKKLIAHEPMTYKVLSQEFDLAGAGIEIVYYLELLKGKLSGKANKKAVFHDPSYLGRYMGVYDLPRELLSGLGYEVIELERTRENAMSSGGFADTVPGVADLASKTILGDAARFGAEILVTSSYYAAAQLKKAASEIGSGIVVKDIVELF